MTKIFLPGLLAINISIHSQRRSIIIKHIGTHNNKKVIILYRKVPNEDHMCLVVYPELLPRHIETALMTAVKSEEGQQASNLAEIVHAIPMPNGLPLLALIHKEGFIKKINTNQTIITPIEGSTQSSARLDEINRIIDDLEAGSNAATKLAGLDKNSGMGIYGRTTSANIMEGKSAFNAERSLNTANMAATPISAADGALSDADLAQINLTQASQLRLNAENLIAEATRLEAEAKSFLPVTETVASQETTIDQVSGDEPTVPSNIITSTTPKSNVSKKAKAAQS